MLSTTLHSKIMVVDDSDAVRELIGAFFTDTGLRHNHGNRWGRCFGKIEK